MWTPTTREQHSRKALRYQTDLTESPECGCDRASFALHGSWHGTAPVMADAKPI